MRSPRLSITHYRKSATHQQLSPRLCHTTFSYQRILVQENRILYLLDQTDYNVAFELNTILKVFRVLYPRLIRMCIEFYSCF